MAIALALLGLGQLWAAQIADRNRKQQLASPPDSADYSARANAGFVDAKSRLIVPFRLTGVALLIAALVVALAG